MRKFRVHKVSNSFYEINGILTPRPLTPFNLSHVGLFYDDLAKAINFYRDILGLAVTDVGARAYLGGGEAPRLVFVRAGSEHHCVSLFPKNMRLPNDDARLQHSAWDIQTYSELLYSVDFLAVKGFKPEFLVRRLPGSNYAVYLLDPEANRIELAYGLEVIGWQGRPKPVELWRRFLVEGRLPPAPINPPEEEIEDVRKEFAGFGENKCTYSGDRAFEIVPPPKNTSRFNASGESRLRPFKIARIRYYAIRCYDLQALAKFYEEILGLRIISRGEKGEILFSSKSSNGPQLKLFPNNYQVGKNDGSRLVTICFEMRSYGELLAASKYLKSNGVPILYEGRGESPDIHNEFCIDIEDASGNPIRLSFSPDTNGLRERAESRMRSHGFSGLPENIECD